MYVDFLGSFENIHFLVYTAVVTFGQLLENFGLLYISASGHTGACVLEMG